ARHGALAKLRDVLEVLLDPRSEIGTDAHVTQGRSVQSIPDVHEPLVDRHLRRGALLHGLDVSPHRQLGLEVGTSSDEPSDDADTVPTESYLVGVAHLVRPGIAVVVHPDVAVEGVKATQQGVIDFLSPGQGPDLRHDAPEFWDLAEGLHN